MAFDDHEITDDWYIHRQMREDVLGSPLGRRIVTNGLCAYSVFQMWGNTPAQFRAGEARWYVPEQPLAVAWRGVERELRQHLHRVGTASAGFAAGTALRLRGHPSRAHVIVLDTRTRRGYPSENDEEQPTCFPAPRSTHRSATGFPRVPHASPLRCCVSPAPVFGHPIAEFGQDLASGVMSTSTLDHETWLVTTRRASFERLLEALTPCRSVLILSGRRALRVHIQRALLERAGRHRRGRGVRAARLQRAQEPERRHKVAERASTASPPLFLGWPSEGMHVRVTESENWWVPGSPAVYEYNPDDFGTVDPRSGAIRRASSRMHGCWSSARAALALPEYRRRQHSSAAWRRRWSSGTPRKTIRCAASSASTTSRSFASRRRRAEPLGR